MNTETIRILLVEDSTGDSWLIQQLLAEVSDPAIQLEVAEQLSTALDRLAEEHFQAVLLDLSLPDSQGLETFLQVHTHAPEAAVVILTGLADEALGRIAVREGAQDYLLKGQVDSARLARALTYAITRQRLQSEFRAQSLTDDLTGLYNRRGFTTLAGQHWKLAYRTNRPFLLIFADMDGLKKINDTLGHRAGDAALRQTAQILQQTFREADIVARLGGDEFIVLVTEAPADRGQSLLARLQHNLKNHNCQEANSFTLALSVGAAYFDPAEPLSLEELICSADTAMYAQKVNRQKEAV